MSPSEKIEFPALPEKFHADLAADLRRPGDRFNDFISGHEYGGVPRWLIEEYGYHSQSKFYDRYTASGIVKGCDFTRPGKTAAEGKSLTVLGTNSIWVWSDTNLSPAVKRRINDPLIDKARLFDPFGFRVFQDFDGDFSAAVKAILDEHPEWADGKTISELVIDESSSNSQPAQSSSSSADNTRRLRVVTADSVTMKRTRFLRDGWIPLGSLGVIAGFGGLGKSTWWAAEAADYTKGRAKGEFDGQPVNVLVLTAEDVWNSTIKPRLVAADADLEKVHFLALADEDDDEPVAGTISMPDDLKLLEQAIVEYQIKWVVFDPLVSFLDSETDSHKDASVRQVLDPLNQIAARHDIGVTGVMHFNKSETSDPYKKLSSSSAFWNACRYVMFFGQETQASDDDPIRYLAPAKFNLTRFPLARKYEIESVTVMPTRSGEESAETSKLRFLVESQMTARELFTLSRGQDRSSRDLVMTHIEEQLSINGGAVEASVIQDDAKQLYGASAATVRRALTDLGLTTIKHGKGKWWWHRPELSKDSALQIIAFVEQGGAT